MMMSLKPPSDCPNFLLPLLSSQGSLTAHLEKLANQTLLVQVIYEGLQPLSLSQKRSLKLDPNKPALAWVRTSLLYGDDPNPWVQASSIFPLSSLKGNLKRLRHLGSTPVGYVIFKKNTRLPHQRFYYRKIQQQTNYGRQTLYNYRGHKLLIDECFITENLRDKLTCHQNLRQPTKLKQT